MNGAPVDGVMTLKDGTQVFTLQRFLEDHKDRLDEAFQYLSNQAARASLTRAKDIGNIRGKLCNAYLVLNIISVKIFHCLY